MIQAPSKEKNRVLYYAFNFTVIALLSIVIFINVRFALYFLNTNLNSGGDLHDKNINTDTNGSNKKVAIIDNAKYKKTTLKIDGVDFEIFIADNAALQEQGLSGWTSLQSSQGMLFVFNKDGKYPFWMKDMNFPIDIVWLDSTYNIVHIEKDLAPSTYPNSFSSNLPARYVLELPANTIKTDSKISL